VADSGPKDRTGRTSTEQSSYAPAGEHPVITAMKRELGAEPL
jgi:hypothetical protein